MTHERTWDGDVEREKAAREWGGNSLKTGLGIPEGPGAQRVSIYFAVHEFLTLEAAESYVHHVAGNTNLDSTGTTTYNGHVPLGVYHLRVKSFLSDAHYSVMGRSV
ncbi:hypothetical protein D9758_018570 [Tetrapyrgos nigripes]|uniref:Uncharacterized protein n=1 Tax=Tetrapyrgos nigripes TaxID=182062 RepID=A0A8H5B160_9AGAR|nr:hypothetical protein D9758_018570 [Tetrapyrgos nigripes]